MQSEQHADLAPATESLNEKPLHSKKYERFGEIIRYFTIKEITELFDSIDNYKHKLMFEIIYELGCRVGEFVRIQVKHLDFSRSTVFFPADDLQTCCLPCVEFCGSIEFHPA
jgi:integrase